MSTAIDLVRAAVLGVAVGGRASSALTALTASPAKSDPSWLARPAVRIAAVAISVGEVIGDKLPRTPSRLEPAGLVARLVVGSAAGGLLGRRSGAPVVVAGGLGLVGTYVGSHLGARWRQLAASRFDGQDLPGALIEDAAVASLAAIATR